MGLSLSIEAVRTNGDSGTEQTEQIRNATIEVVNSDRWSDYVDLQSEIGTAIKKLGITPKAIVVEKLVHPASNIYGTYGSSIRVHSNYDRYGENYVVLKRMGTALHYNFKIIIAW